ncbi:hypothetical protein NECAME_05352 [Necator americanus]|uniref:Uncharacterized protein n=1 Tax=Necator americanus TaxID=51031 RepID=W2SHQ4_NECAM|nr:hypothetical protein NECAME_05352 [Necator americanus]ETN69135.1 hypothetical protein NECAME_05352 [Necator americanus]
MQAHTGREDEKDKYRTCCAVCHIKFGTAVLGVIEAVVCVTVLISAVQQVIWKSGGSQDCFQNILRDCLIFQFSHFNVTLIFDYIVIIMMIGIIISVFLLFCGILSDTSSLLLPHIIIQAIFLLFSIGYFCLYAVSYFYGDLYIQSRPFTVNHFVERMWLATLLVALALFQTYLFSAVIRCSMYISSIEDVRRRRESAFERCSERVRLAKENGLWRTTSWGGSFQQYKGQYDENKPKKAPKQKNFHVQWREKSAAIEEEEDDTTMNLIEYETEPKSDFHEPLIKMESVDETTKSTSKKNSQSELLRKTSSQEAGRISHAHSSFDQPTTSKTSTASSEVQSLRSHHKESHASTSSHRRLSDMPSQEFDNTGAFAKRRKSSSPRSSLKKHKSVDPNDAPPEALESQRQLPDDSRRTRRHSSHKEGVNFCDSSMIYISIEEAKNYG